MPTSSERPNRRRTTSEVQEWAETLSADQLLCRDLGHQWTPYRAWHDSKNREYVQILQCARCHSERQRHLDYRGQRLNQSYNYEDGYLAPKGSGAWSADGRADLRLVSLLRLIDNSDSPPADIAAARKKRKAG